MVAEHAVELAGACSVAVAPLMLGPRIDSLDSRLHDDFGALWLLTALTQLGGAGIARVTFACTHGPGGILCAQRDTPTEKLLRTVAAAERLELLSGETRSMNGFSFYAVVLQSARSDTRELLVPNPTDADLEFTALGHGGLRVPPRTLGRFSLSV